MDIRRIARHLFYTDGRVRRAFPRPGLDAIEQAIEVSEATHDGEIRFAVEGALDGMDLWRGQSARARALAVFSRLRMWDTEHNNGVLLYVLLADHAVEIVADRGIHARVGFQGWEGICRQMEAAFARGNFEAGALLGIAKVTEALQQHYPSTTARANELPDAPMLLA